MIKQDDLPISTADALTRAAHARAAQQHAAQHGANASLLAGRPKAVREAPVHPGMTDRQKAGAGLGGMGHAFPNAPDASSACPLDREPPSKPFQSTPAPPVTGQRSRVGETAPELPGAADRRNRGRGVEAGQADDVLGEAVASGGWNPNSKGGAHNG